MPSIFDKDPKTELTGLQTLFGNVTMPQIMKPTNKQLIDAAILRGSLELLKPRQPGENLASQASRALEAAQQPAKILTDYNAAIQAAKAKGIQPQVTITPAKMFGFYKVGQTLMKTNKKFRDAVRNLKGTGLFSTEAQALRAVTNNAMGIESQEGEGMSKAIIKSLDILSENVTKETSVSNIEGDEDVIKSITENINKTDPFSDAYEE
jgi:hypothetical protein